jgi:hypothetical protein
LLAGFVLIPPTVDVTVNGSDGPLTIGPGTPVQMSLAFDPGNGASLNPGEVYAGIATPFGLYWKTPTGYTLTPTRLYAGPVPNFGPIALISVGAGLLPPGTYTWITIVDNDTNGVINAHYYDYVVTTVVHGRARRVRVDQRFGHDCSKGPGHSARPVTTWADEPAVSAADRPH